MDRSWCCPLPISWEERILTAVLDSWVDYELLEKLIVTVEPHLFGKRGTSASKRRDAMAFTRRGGPCLEAPGPARPGPAIMPREQDGRQISSSAYYVASASPQRPFSALPHSRPRLPVTRAAILGFLYRFQRRTNEAIGSGFHRSLPVVPISPPLSRIHVGGFTFFGFSAERCTRLSRRWWRWFGGRTQTQAPGAWLIQCGDYDGDLYREDPLESEGGFGNIIVVDNLPVMPLENFAKLESVRCTIKKREARIFRRMDSTLDKSYACS
ncbi:uncharacterized protein LOC103972192 [Musa acuminata AAA Group]|uniref:uncharacterized protein LOC103972192 n=1 Tax=Musa acuminata AAA Group TaxID=214697 RepID=UPI0031D6C5D7